MKKMIFAAMSAALLAGCAELPKEGDTGVKEETIVMTGSHIPRKASNASFTNTRVIDKEELARQVQNQSATINAPAGR
jgi:hypothetical protein